MEIDDAEAVSLAGIFRRESETPDGAGSDQQCSQRGEPRQQGAAHLVKPGW